MNGRDMIFPFLVNPPWLNARDLGLTGAWAMRWDSYIEIIKEVGVRLKAKNDKLVWQENKKTGIITAKLSYNFIVKDWSKEEKRWWYKYLWKWNLPQELKGFWCLCLKDKILTWHNIMKRGWKGPRFLSL